MKSFREWIREEGVAANAVGGGAVAGLGVGPQGEPGGTPPGRKRKRGAFRGTLGFASSKLLSRKAPTR